MENATQLAYERMRVYLTRPGARRAATNSGFCVYEGVIGGELHRCAVGLLLTPTTLSHFVVQASEGPTQIRCFAGAIDELLHVEDRPEMPELAGISLEFLMGAQQIHDKEENWKGGVFNVQALDDLAREMGLAVVVDEPAAADPEPALV